MASMLRAKEAAFGRPNNFYDLSISASVSVTVTDLVAKGHLSSIHEVGSKEPHYQGLNYIIQDASPGTLGHKLIIQLPVSSLCLFINELETWGRRGVR